MDESQEKELADDLIAIIQHFAARTYGARASRTTAKILSADTIKRAKELHDAGNSVWQIEEKLAAKDSGQKAAPNLSACHPQVCGS